MNKQTFDATKSRSRSIASISSSVIWRFLCLDVWIRSTIWLPRLSTKSAVSLLLNSDNMTLASWQNYQNDVSSELEISRLCSRDEEQLDT